MNIAFSLVMARSRAPGTVDHAIVDSRSAPRRGLIVVAAIALMASAVTVGVADAAPSAERVVLEVTVEKSPLASSVEAATNALGGDVIGRAPGVALVEIPADTVERLVKSIRAVGGHVREPVAVDVRPDRARSLAQQFDPTTGGAERLTNAVAWHDAGFTGRGVRIGVIDYFDTRYWDTDEHGPLPVAGTTAMCRDLGRDCTNRFFDGRDQGGEDHGVAIVEVIRDLAPDAEIFLGQATTLSDYQALIDWFGSKEVQLINRSLGSRYDGPGDGRGPLDEIVADAADRGIVWVNSGGNNGDRRYYREPVRMSGDRIAFGPDGGDTFLEFRGCVRLAGVRWANDWDLPALQRTDYDVYLWDSPTGDPAGGSIVDSSTRRQRLDAPPIEHLGADLCPSVDDHSLYLEARLADGTSDGDVFEVADYGDGIAEHTQAPYSAAVPIVDSDAPGVIGVGAIEPADGIAIAGYSSRGPTNDGRVAPDVVAPSGFASTTVGRFDGTSAAAAVVTGGAALLLGGDLAVGGDPLADLVRHIAVDRGRDGPDGTYGYGQFVLPDPPDDAEMAPSTFVALATPERVLDTRPNSPVGPRELTGDVSRGDIIDLPIVESSTLVDDPDDPGDDITAVAVNIVSVNADRRSYVQAMPTLRAELGGFSNLNIDTVDATRQTRANFAIVPVDDDGSISLYSIADGNIVVDLLGSFRTADDEVRAGRFVELDDPERVLDSRRSATVRPLASNEVREVPMPSGVDPNLVDALVVTVTATNVSSPGWVQAIPAAGRSAVGSTSTLNVQPGDTVANAAIVPIDGGGIALAGFFTDDEHADVIVDVTGYITSDEAAPGMSGRFVAVRPDRAFDSRDDGGALGDRQAVTVDARSIGVPASASGVVWNVTIAGATRRGHAVGWATDAAEPETSLLNWAAPGTTRASSAVTAVSDARARFALEDGPADSTGPIGHLVIDTFGYFT